MPQSWEAAENKARKYIESRDKLSEQELVNKGLKFVIGISDRPAPGNSLDGKLQFHITHNRRVFIPLRDGRFFSIKASGQLDREDRSPLFYTDAESRMWGGSQEEEIENLKSRLFNPEKGKYPSQLGWRRIHKLPDGNGGFKSVGELSKHYDFTVQIYEIILSIDRLNDLPGIAQDPDALDRLAWQVSYSLSNFYGQEIILNSYEMMTRRLETLGRILAYLVNNGLTMQSLHTQDPTLADELSDITEVYNFKSGIWKASPEIEYIRENFGDGFKILKRAWGKSGKYRSKLFSGIFEAFEIFVGGYVDTLNETLLNMWDKELAQDNNYVYSVIVTEDIMDEVENTRVHRNLRYKMYERFHEMIKDKLRNIGKQVVERTEGSLRENNLEMIQEQQFRKGIPKGIDSEASRGGIDLTPANLNLQIKGGNVNFLPQYDPAQIEQMNLEGLSPLILKIIPMTNVPVFMGVGLSENNPTGEAHDKSKVPDVSYDKSPAVKEFEYELAQVR